VVWKQLSKFNFYFYSMVYRHIKHTLSLRFVGIVMAKPYCISINEKRHCNIPVFNLVLQHGWTVTSTDDYQIDKVWVMLPVLPCCKSRNKRVWYSVYLFRVYIYSSKLFPHKWVTLTIVTHFFAIPNFTISTIIPKVGNFYKRNQ
jgi:hypothetical protein